jgi:hypothetical protein
MATDTGGGEIMEKIRYCCFFCTGEAYYADLAGEEEGIKFHFCPEHRAEAMEMLSAALRQKYEG